MSRETVLALRNFTNQMLKASSLAPPQKPELPPIVPGAKTPSAAAPKKLVPNVTRPAKAPSDIETAYRDFKDPPLILPAQDGQAPTGTTVPPGGATAPTAKTPGMLDSAREYLGNIDTSKIMEYLPYLGGMGAGGLAGYALGNMFQDEDDDSTPWLSTLAGAGLGSVALPYLLNSYLGQPGVTQLGSAPAEDMPLFHPGSEIAPAQNVRPIDTSGLA